MGRVASQMDDTLKPSKALPIAVSGAIAVAVFGILLVANGGGGGKGDRTPTVASLTADKPVDEKPAAQPPADKPPEKPAAPPPDKVADKPADVVPDRPAEKPADKPPLAPVATKTVVLTVSVKPADAKLTVDGKPVSGGKVELPASSTPVKVAATAPGYVSEEKEASAAQDGSVAIELKKEVAEVPKEISKPTPTKTPTPTQPSQPRHPKRPKVDL